MPHPPLGFEIPDEWWLAAGMDRFRPAAPHFTPGEQPEGRPVEVVPLDRLRPLVRSPGFTMDASGFRRTGMVSVLQAIRDGAAIEPVHAFEIEGGDDAGYHHGLYHGCHRFYASVAVGYTHIPIASIGTEADVRRVNEILGVQPAGTG